MPHLESCNRCSFKFNKKTGRWLEDHKLKAVYEKEIKEGDEGAAELHKRLAKYWYRTGGGVSRFKACERCYMHDHGIAELMDHVLDGWTVLSKGEWVEKDLEGRFATVAPFIGQK
jgi:hypothetical protein